MSYAADLANHLQTGNTIPRERWIKSTQEFRVTVLATLETRGLYLSMDETRETFPVVTIASQEQE